MRCASLFEYFCLRGRGIGMGGECMIVIQASTQDLHICTRRVVFLFSFARVCGKRAFFLFGLFAQTKEKWATGVTHCPVLLKVHYFFFFSKCGGWTCYRAVNSDTFSSKDSCCDPLPRRSRALCNTPPPPPPHPWRGEERRGDHYVFFTAAESGGLGKACFVLVRFNGMLS